MSSEAFIFTIFVSVIVIALFAVTFMLEKKGKIIAPVIIFTVIAILFTIIAWNNIILIYTGLAVAFMFVFAFVFIIIVIFLKKNKKIKAPLMTLLSTLITFSLVAGGATFGDYLKDKWFDEFKSQIMEQYPIIKNVELFTNTNPGPGYLRLYFYCDKNIGIKDFEPVFSATKEYLFNNPSGINPSQQSRTRRGLNKYGTIDIYFYTDGEKKVIYEAKSNSNFQTWDVRTSDGNED